MVALMVMVEVELVALREGIRMAEIMLVVISALIASLMMLAAIEVVTDAWANKSAETERRKMVKPHIPSMPPPKPQSER